MQSESAGDSKSTIKFQVMVINTVELNKVLEDPDFDGITLQLSQAIGNNASGGDHKFKFIAYKHFSSKKKQEQITDPKFFASNNETYKDVEIGDSFTTHFGNLKLTRGDMKENVDTDEYPYLILSPDHGTGDYANYIIFHVLYTDNLNAAQPQPPALSRGMSSPGGSKVINPSPPA
ncbi:MAG: hypothetical protein M3015_14135 [Bacteroidota bacterium]|nr:hypothetical protein [Bacteroidota bacterium]